MREEWDGGKGGCRYHEVWLIIEAVPRDFYFITYDAQTFRKIHMRP